MPITEIACNLNTFLREKNSDANCDITEYSYLTRNNNTMIAIYEDFMKGTSIVYGQNGTKLNEKIKPKHVVFVLLTENETSFC